MNDSTEDKYRRLQSEIQAAILRDFPNPERRSCPDRSIIEGLAKHPQAISTQDDVDESSDWHHITHCSPCYASFLEVRDALRSRPIDRRQLTRRAIIATTLAIGVGGVGWFAVQTRNQPRTLEIDLDGDMSFRGEAETGHSQSRPTLPEGQIHLTLRLPSGSDDGMYRVELRSKLGTNPIFGVDAPSALEQGFRKLKLDVNLRVSPGEYLLAVRNNHRDVWRYYPVSV